MSNADPQTPDEKKRQEELIDAAKEAERVRRKRERNVRDNIDLERNTDFDVFSGE